MNIKLPTPGEMPARLYDLMVQRFQSELVAGFTSTDTALNSWILDEHEGVNFLRASFSFDYDVSVEGEYLEQVMAQMAATVRAAGWFAQVDKGSLEISAIDFAELGDRDEDEDEDDADDSEEESDDDEDESDDSDPSAHVSVDPDLIAVDDQGALHGPREDHDGSPDVDGEPDGDSIPLPDDSERELEFEDEEDDESEEDESSDDPISETLNRLERALRNSGLRLGQIEELDDDSLEIEMGAPGSVTEISVKVEPDANASDPDACILWLTVITSDDPSKKFVSVHSLIAYLQEVYGDANKS
jgi:hypothetical protein